MDADLLDQPAARPAAFLITGRALKALPRNDRRMTSISSARP